MTREKTKLAVVAAFAALLGAGMTGCGSDEKKSGDCSACPAANRAECSSTFSDCTKQGGSPAQCQDVADIFCALYGAFDAGSTD